jgi:Four helix bundle sensory module for signal transduction
MRLKIGWRHVVVSLSIAAGGFWGGHGLERVDQDIRIIYADYTLAATDLGHMNARLIRYRTTVLRAVEADTKSQFEGIAASFPSQREHIEAIISRYIKASQKASSDLKVKTQEAVALLDLRKALEQYIDASHRTLELVRQSWTVSSVHERHRLRGLAENHAATNAGPKLIAVSLALDRLLEVVADIANDARKDAESLIRVATTTVIGVSFFLAAGVLLFR